MSTGYVAEPVCEACGEFPARLHDEQGHVCLTCHAEGYDGNVVEVYGVPAAAPCPSCGQPLLPEEEHCPACRIVRPYIPRGDY